MQFGVLADERTYSEVCDFLFLFLRAFRHPLETIVNHLGKYCTWISVGAISVTSCDYYFQAKHKRAAIVLTAMTIYTAINIALGCIFCACSNSCSMHS